MVCLTQTGQYKHRRWLEAGNFRFRKNRNCIICVAKTKVLISFAVTAKLICTFVFAYANVGFLMMRLMCCQKYDILQSLGKIAAHSVYNVIFISHLPDLKNL